MTSRTIAACAMALASCAAATAQPPAAPLPQAGERSFAPIPGEAPPNPHAAGSAWGQFHRNGYAQSSVPWRGPEAGDALEVQTVRIPGRGGAPTQMHASDVYPDGSRTLWSTNLTHLFKVRVQGEAFELVDTYQVNDRVRDWNILWNMQLGVGNEAFVPSPKTRSILRFSDADPSDPRSKIVQTGKFVLPDAVAGAAVVINLTYDGWLVFVTDEAWIGAVRTDFSESRFLDLPSITNDVTTHNSFPIDEDGNVYLVSYGAMTKVRWTGDGFELAWRVPYDFRGPGCPPPSENDRREVLKAVTGKACTGSGTTPTLMGRGEMDRLVIAVDSHAPNNLVAFWRDEVPEGWVGLPGRDRRVAAVLPLPHSTHEGRGFTAENSPPVAGYDAGVAQFAGFFPKCRRRAAPRGVQLARWDPDADRIALVWANPDVAMNNVMTISTGSGLVYGSGRDQDCVYRYRGLDAETGEVAFALPMGKDAMFVDGGNSNVVLPEDRSVVFGTGKGVVRIRPVAAGE